MSKVMLAEDDLTMVGLLKTLLGMEGFQVSTLIDQYDKAIENIRREAPDVLILDVFLGEHSGLDVIRELRKADDLKHMVVIMTSGMNLEDQCLSGGADNFILKPYMPDELLLMIRELLSA